MVRVMASTIDTVCIRGAEVYASRSYLFRTYQDRFIWVGDYRLSPVLFSSFSLAEEKAEELHELEGRDWSVNSLAKIHYVFRADSSCSSSPKMLPIPLDGSRLEGALCD
jgi:hypothetical protein